MNQGSIIQGIALEGESVRSLKTLQGACFGIEDLKSTLLPGAGHMLR